MKARASLFFVLMFSARFAPRLAFALALVSTLSAVPAAHAAAPVTAEFREPRAFGWRVGDVLERCITLTLPAGAAVDERSLPALGQRGRALELRQVEWRGRGSARELCLRYQVFLSPREARVLEMPVFTLRFLGSAATQTLRVDAWPVVVGPLVPVAAPSRNGLGELRPEARVLRVGTEGPKWRLTVVGVLMLPLLAYLAHVYFGAAWWARRHRPFDAAWRGLRASWPAAGVDGDVVGQGLRQQAAYTLLHRALNHAAGAVLHPAGLDRWLAAQPRFEPLRADIAQFFERSRAVFFGSAAAAEDSADEARWLRDLCRRCRDVDRGSA
jgi:mxaA protein